MQKALVIVIFLVLATGSRIKGQKFEWIWNYSDHEDASEKGQNIGVDRTGAIYVNSFKQVYGGPGGASTGGMFRYKLDSAGNLLQTTQISGNRGAVWDKEGNMYTVFESIKKYNKNGVLLWDSLYPDFVFDHVEFIDSTKLIAVGFKAYTSKTILHCFNTNGNTVWRTEDAGTGGYPLSTDNAGTIYSLETDPGYIKVFNINSVGAIIAQNQYGGGYETHIAGSTLGFAIGTSTNCISTCYRISYYAINGAVLWQKGIKGAGLRLRKMKFDKEGNLYIAGDMMYPVEFDGFTFYETNARTFIIKINSAGNLIWYKIASCLNGNSTASIRDFTFTQEGDIIFTGLNKNGIFDQISTSTYGLAEILVGKLRQPKKLASSIKETDKDNAFFISPVPTSGIFEVYFNEPPRSATQVFIHNSLGQVVYSQTLHSDCTRKSFNFEEYPKGVYFVICKTDKGTFTKKIVLQ